MRRSIVFFKPDECASANEKDIRRIHGREFLVRVFAPALRRHIGDRTFQDFQQGLLHAFAGDIPGDRRVLVLL